MQRWITLLAVSLAATLFVGCGPEPPQSADEAYKEFKNSIRELETPEEKTALCEDFLERFPTSEYTGWLAGAVAYYRGHAMEDAAGAVKVLDQILATIDDPEARFEVQIARFPLAQEIGKETDLGAIISTMEAHRPLTFSEYLDVGEMAAEHELWSLAENQAAGAASLATPEAWRADYPDTELDEEAIAAKSDNRRILAAANRGWALAHLDRVTEALETFETAAPLSQSNYLGVPSTDLFSYWGRAALASGDADKAMELLGPTAVLGDDDEAFDAFKEAYIAVHADDAGFDDFVWSSRQRLAKMVDTFELPDYQGALHDFGDTRGKVVFLSFWFPT